MKQFALLLAIAAPILAQSLTGTWSSTLSINGVSVPFLTGVATDGEKAQGWFFNGDQKVASTSGTFRDGKLTLNFDQYASKLEANYVDGKLVGTYGRQGRAPNVFTAQRHQGNATAGAGPDIAGNWEIPVKSPKGEAAWHFIVRQNGPEVRATILRIDGDTGTLSGSYQGNKFVLSHFSGARPNLIEVALQADGSLQLLQNGTTQYTANRESEARAKGLPAPNDPFHHTMVKDPRVAFAFSFPDLSGKLVSNTDERFLGKVVVVAISGSWCPNCHDEAPFLEALYKKYKDQGLEVVALSFEEEEQLKNPARLRAFVKAYGIDYTVLLAGETRELHEKLPEAVNLNSWPTTFFLGRDGRVRQVHAGFAGPASADYNKSQNDEVASLVEGLLAEGHQQISSKRSN
jgi:thiol-disulfide isomerase/thioredoxin